MPNQFLRKIISLSEKTKLPLPLDGELLYGKSGVCVHPPGLLSNLHHSGFLAVTAKVKDGRVSLILNWSPRTNASIEKLMMKETPPQVRKLVDKVNANDAEYCCINNLNSPLMACDEPLCVTEENQAGIATTKPIDVTSSQFQVLRSRHQAFGPFALDLSLMQSIRIYFANESHTNGQLFVTSPETQCKILHFHNGGLNSVVDILKKWSPTSSASKRTKIDHLSIIYPNLSPDQLHPEEGLYRKLTVETWSLLVDEFGRIQNEANIQKAVFFGGIEDVLRPVVWQFLLKLYNFTLTGEERSELQQKKLMHYRKINNEREKIFSQQLDDNFWKNIACSIEKDVLRTDRSNPFFKGEGNPNLDVLQRLLLNYAVFTGTGYTQGMSDLLSPLLIEIQVESNVFWCFVGLMQRTIFISSPSDNEMEKQLFYLLELLRVLLPSFFDHLMSCDPGAKELLFAHRWILLCFKREFCESEALMIWEACWAHYQCNYFHLFICVAIISLYGNDVTEKKLAADEMLLHFSNLALQMNGILVLKKARGLLHRIRTSPSLPCTLHDLLCMEGSSITSVSHMPVVVCSKTKLCVDGCPHETQPGQKALDSPRFKLKKLFHRLD